MISGSASSLLVGAGIGQLIWQWAGRLWRAPAQPVVELVPASAPAPSESGDELHEAVRGQCSDCVRSCQAAATACSRSPSTWERAVALLAGIGLAGAGFAAGCSWRSWSVRPVVEVSQVNHVLQAPGTPPGQPTVQTKSRDPSLTSDRPLALTEGIEQHPSLAPTYRRRVAKSSQ